MYGTLVDIRTNEQKAYLWEKMAEMFGFCGANYEKKELKQKYFQYIKEAEEELRKTEEYPEIKIDLVVKRLFLEKGKEIDDATVDVILKMIRVLSTKFVRLYDGVIDLLEELKRKNKKVYLLSNAQRGFTAPELTYLGIEKYFDGIFISSDKGCKKPGESFYRKLVEEYKLDVKKSIMIGNDSIADILGAYNMGMDSLYIHTEISPECVEDLKSTYTIMDGDFTKIKKLVLK